jgi:Holliday junction DNA helicase RuvA
VLSGLPTAELIASIRTGDVQKLVRIPGVGKKTAERMILELKDKLTGVETGGKGTTVPPAASALSPLEQDVLSALLNLGCARPAAEEAIGKAKKQGVGAEFEPLFRSALALVR